MIMQNLQNIMNYFVFVFMCLMYVFFVYRIFVAFIDEIRAMKDKNKPIVQKITELQTPIAVGLVVAWLSQYLLKVF